LANLAGYKLYYGQSSRTYDFVKTIGDQTTYAISGLEQGRTYFVTVTAYDASGNESSFSNEVSVTIPPMVSPFPMLTQDPLAPGREAQFRVTGANPDEVVSFLFSNAGEGYGPCAPKLGGLCVDIVNPLVFGQATADAEGTAVLMHKIPDNAPAGAIISIQAVIQRGPEGAYSIKTNAITAKLRELP
jgi:hypothetical protein